MTTLDCTCGGGPFHGAECPSGPKPWAVDRLEQTLEALTRTAHVLNALVNEERPKWDPLATINEAFSLVGRIKNEAAVVHESGADDGGSV